MNEVTIRKATINDLDTLLEFEQGVISAERPFDPTLKPHPPNYDDIEKMISAANVELVVAEFEGKLVGSGYARIEDAKPYLRHSQHAYLGFMYVVPEQRGKGINKMIMDVFAAWSVSQGMTELRLDVYHQNDSAIKAYEKIGFIKYMIAMRKGL